MKYYIFFRIVNNCIQIDLSKINNIIQKNNNTCVANEICELQYKRQ